MPVYFVKIRLKYKEVFDSIGYFCANTHYVQQWAYLNENTWARKEYGMYISTSMSPNAQIKSKFHANFIMDMITKYDNEDILSIEVVEV